MVPRVLESRCRIGAELCRIGAELCRIGAELTMSDYESLVYCSLALGLGLQTIMFTITILARVGLFVLFKNLASPMNYFTKHQIIISYKTEHCYKLADEVIG